jgi:hypothetical protein
MNSILSDIESVICKGDSINKAYNLKQRIKDQMVRFLLAKCKNDYRFDMDLKLHRGSPLWIMRCLKTEFIRNYILQYHEEINNKDRIKALFTLDDDDWFTLKENDLICQNTTIKHTEKTIFKISGYFIDHYSFSIEFEDEIIKYLMYRK